MTQYVVTQFFYVVGEPDDSQLDVIGIFDNLTEAKQCVHDSAISMMEDLESCKEDMTIASSSP